MDNTYALMSNFFGFLMPSVKSDDEIIIVCDGCDSLTTMNYIELMAQKDSRIHLIKSETKLGFAKANNLAANVAVQIATFCGQQGRISRTIRAILSGQL